jgi:hypothetical protein
MGYRPASTALRMARELRLSALGIGELFMAGKMNVMKLLQEMRGLAVFGNRRPQPKMPAIALAQWRSQAARMPRVHQKRTIRITAEAPLDIPHPVKIIHVKAKNSAVPEPPAH